MTDVEGDLVRQLVREEIRRTVADAIEQDSCLSAGESASTIARMYPRCGMSPDEVAGEIIAAAVSARVPLELSRPSRLASRRP